MLAQIAKNVQEGKVTQMDPTLSEEVKKLLGGVRAGVDDHVKDFRGQLTSEVQRMFKEVSLPFLLLLLGSTLNLVSFAGWQASRREEAASGGHC